MNRTLQLVREEVIQPIAFTLMAHEQKSERVLGREMIIRPWHAEYHRQLSELDTSIPRMVVNDKFALRFNYHAILRGGPIVGEFEYHPYVWDCKTAYYYAGDVPDSVLDKIELFQGGPVTVHSMEELPLRKTHFLLRSDPVAIGWIDYPEFIRTWTGWKTVSPGGRGGCGIVLAIWDGEKEISIL